MSDCNETLRELERFLDGELTDSTRGAIEGHINGCMDCLSAFDFHAELKTVIRERARNEQVPDGLKSRILECFGPVVDDQGAAEDV